MCDIKRMKCEIFVLALLEKLVASQEKLVASQEIQIQELQTIANKPTREYY